MNLAWICCADMNSSSSGLQLTTLIVAIVALVIAALALCAACATWYSGTIKPHLRARLWTEGQGRVISLTLESSKHATIQIAIENIGDSGLSRTPVVGRLWPGRPSATRVSAFMYFDPKFDISCAWRYEDPDEKVHTVWKASPLGRFAGLCYVSIPTVVAGGGPPVVSIISYSEAVICVIEVVTPSDSGRYPLLVQKSSAEGDLGVDELEIVVIDRVHGPSR